MSSLAEVIRKNCPPLAPIPTGLEPKLNKLDHVKAVLFDVYGTLFVSGSGDVGTAAATDTAEALTQALVVSGFSGELEQAGLVGKDLLKAEIMEWHKAGHEAGVDFPEVEISKVWRKIIDALSNTQTLTNPEVDLDTAQTIFGMHEIGISAAQSLANRFCGTTKNRCVDVEIFLHIERISRRSCDICVTEAADDRL